MSLANYKSIMSLGFDSGFKYKLMNLWIPNIDLGYSKKLVYPCLALPVEIYLKNHDQFVPVNPLPPWMKPGHSQR